jgi:hypothetical protein
MSEATMEALRGPESRSIDTERLRLVLAERAIVLDRELGRGGMSVVYLARDLRHNRLVAVKILRPGVPSGAERCVHEIETISPLVHPSRGIEAAVRRQLHTGAASGS